jgi:osmotically-inducible protein OsmY
MSVLVEVDSHINVRPTVAADIKIHIEPTFCRHATLDATGIAIHVDDGTVTLTGYVASCDERNTAENAGWSASGVAKVDNQLVGKP